jgi:hypothetical protein
VTTTTLPADMRTSFGVSWTPCPLGGAWKHAGPAWYRRNVADRREHTR